MKVIVDMNDNVFNELLKRHPDPGPISENTLLNGSVENIPISYFDLIDENMIQKAARQTKGAGGPSQLDADQYHHILLALFKKGHHLAQIFKLA